MTSWRIDSFAKGRIVDCRRTSIAYRLLIVATVAGLFAGCTKPAPPPTVADLAYPVVVLFEQGGAVRHDTADDLAMMAVQRVMASSSPPVLIDSRLDIYRLDALESVHSGLWLMANPSARTEVHFILRPEAIADLRMARQLIAARTALDAETTARVAQANTLAEMLVAIGK